MQELERALSAAEELTMAGQFADAREILDQILKVGRNPRALNNLGFIQYRNGELDDALRSFIRALAMDNSHKDALDNLIATFEQHPKETLIVHYAQRALTLFPHSPTVSSTLKTFIPEPEPAASRHLSLHEIGGKFGTDKQDAAHSHAGLSYLHIYDRYFAALRDQPINYLEIGVLDGQSLRTFAEYFSKGKIYGLDINPTAKAHESNRIDVTIGSQGDPQTLMAVGDKVDYFDIIIDDGSHATEHMMASWKYLFPKVRPGGFYIIEDAGCSYSDPNMGWPGMQYNGKPLKNNRAEFEEFILENFRSIDGSSETLRSVHYYNNIVLFEKIKSS